MHIFELIALDEHFIDLLRIRFLGKARWGANNFLVAAGRLVPGECEWVPR
jgi:hypothetical protein